MAVFRVEKNKNYSVMANYHFRDRTLSWKAKGILSNMLSLPDDWDYSLAGLTALSSDGACATSSAIKELEKHGYLERRPLKEKGKIYDWEYIIYESPRSENPLMENLKVENLDIENQIQLNTKKINNINNNSIIKRSFVAPTLEEIESYCKERKNNVDAKKFFDYFETSGWVDSKGNKVKNWKQKVITWEQYNTKPLEKKEFSQRTYTEEMNSLFDNLDNFEI